MGLNPAADKSMLFERRRVEELILHRALNTLASGPRDFSVTKKTISSYFKLDYK